MTPGTYLRTRREAVGLSMEKLLGMIGTVPAIPEHRRREWLEGIENDTIPPDQFALHALRSCFRFDVRVANQLIDIHHYAAALPVPRLCRSCGCSNADPCNDGGRGCGWAEYDLCTICEQPGGNGPHGGAAAMPVPGQDNARHPSGRAA